MCSNSCAIKSNQIETKLLPIFFVGTQNFVVAGENEINYLKILIPLSTLQIGLSTH